MSLRKAIKSGKEHRKQYYGSKSIDPMCRNNKGCKWCEDNRKYQDNKLKEKVDYELRNFNRD